MRLAIDSQVRLIEPVFKADPSCGHVLVFLGKSRDKAKIVAWDRAGFLPKAAQTTFMTDVLWFRSIRWREEYCGIASSACEEGRCSTF